MKVGVVLDGSAWGGVESYAAALVSRLSLAGNELQMVTTSPNCHSKLLAMPHTRCLATLGVPSRIAGLVRWARRFDPRIVHFVLAYETQFLPDVLVLSLLRRHVVLSEQLVSATIFQGNGLFGSLKKAIARRVKLLSYCGIAAAVAPSRAAASILVATHGLPSRKVLVALNPCDCNTVAGQRRTPVAGPLRLLCVARLVPQKGVDTLLRSVALARQQEVRVHLTVVGDGPDRRALEHLAAQLGLGESVLFVGEVGDVAPYFANADVFALTSRYEGLPFAVLEAMCAGLPVIATAVSGTPEAVVDEVTGRLIPPDDPYAVSHAIAHLARDAAARIRMGERGAARVRRVFDWGSHLDTVVRLYGEVCASEPTRDGCSQKKGSHPRKRGARQ